MDNIKFICSSKAFARWSRYVMAVPLSPKCRMTGELRLICKDKKLYVSEHEDLSFELEVTSDFDMKIEPAKFMRLSSMCNSILEQPVVVNITPTQLFVSDPIYF